MITGIAAPANKWLQRKVMHKVLTAPEAVRRR